MSFIRPVHFTCLLLIEKEEFSMRMYCGEVFTNTCVMYSEFKMFHPLED